MQDADNMDDYLPHTGDKAGVKEGLGGGKPIFDFSKSGNFLLYTFRF